uniref:CDP-alcohol phosphatidyltransferase n=1 Tax=viral metagenome TaxID=1070528 RepID=A0A6C0JSR0_9ZZZZ
MSLDNPFDNLLISGCDVMIEGLYNMGVTPNMITILGILFRIWSIWALFNGYKIMFVAGALLGYYCDCLDGHLARSYGLTTPFGDFLDHFSDLTFQIGILLYIWINRNNKLFLPAIIFYLIFLLIFLVHMGCQQQYYSNNEMAESLDALKDLCHDKNWIHFTKFFGCGTFVTFSIIVGLLF